VIKARSRPPGFDQGFLAEQVGSWWEGWMRQADQVLEDEQLVTIVYDALTRRRPKSSTRGRWGTPAEIVLRMLVLKHVRGWSFQDVEWEVRANLVYRQFTRVGAGTVPDAKALVRQAQALGPEIIQRIHERLVGIARQNKIVTGRKLRVDTTVVETNIHYPTDSSLLGDGVRVLTRVMQEVTDVAGEVGTKLRNRSRSVKLRVVEIARVSRSKSEQGQQKMKDLYGKVLEASGRVARQAQQFVNEIASGVKRSADFKKQMALEGMKKELEVMVRRVKQVRHQTRERVFRGNTHVEGKLASMFEHTTEIIRRGQAKQPTEFGKMIKVQEAEGQIIVDYEVFDKRPADSDLLVPSIAIHQQRLGRVPEWVAADAGFYSAEGEKKAHQQGVKYISVPNRSTKSPERRKLQKTRWFKKGQKWRTGCEGRISVLKRRHGLNRCRYKGDRGMKRWVGLGVISDTLINIARALVDKPAKT
jgi:transposase, IS5 family